MKHFLKFFSVIEVFLIDRIFPLERVKTQPEWIIHLHHLAMHMLHVKIIKEHLNERTILVADVNIHISGFIDRDGAALCNFLTNFSPSLI